MRVVDMTSPKISICFEAAGLSSVASPKSHTASEVSRTGVLPSKVISILMIRPTFALAMVTAPRSRAPLAATVQLTP